MKLHPEKHKAIIAFKQFLIDKNCLENFKCNCNIDDETPDGDGGLERLINLNNNGDYSSFVDVVFIWSSTEEGSEFWSDIHYAWVSYVETYKNEWR